MAASRFRVWDVTASDLARIIAVALVLCGCSAGEAGGGGSTEDDVAADGDVVADAAGDAAADTVETPDSEGEDAEPDVPRDATLDDGPTDVDLDPVADADVVDGEVVESDAADGGADGAADATDSDWLDGLDADVDGGEMCEGDVTVSLSATEVSVWTRVGASSRRVSVDASLSGTACGELQVLSSAPWLSATWDDDILDVEVADDAPAGRLDGQIAMVHSGDPGLLAMVDVTARVFPGPGGQPKVLFVGVDGMRSDAMLFADTPSFDGLRRVGAWTLDGRTHDGTTDSSVGWTSLFTGVQPARHGVLNNGSMDTRDWSYPGFAWIARNELEARTSMVAHWVPAAVNLNEDDAFDDVLLGDDAYVASSTAAWLRDGDYDLWMTHFDDVDHAGHGHGFSPVIPDYVAAIEQTDAYAGLLVDALLARDTLTAESWLVVLVTDHGGEGTSHGAQNLPNQRIPFVFAGSTVPIGQLLGDPVTHMDVAPTVLAHLGYTGSTEHGFDGQPRAFAADMVDPDGRAPSNEAVCDDRVDEDGDAALDCDDDDCDVAGPCAPVCAERDLGNAVGPAVATGSNEGEDTDFSVTCARLPGAADVSFEWTAPTSGRFRIDTAGSSYDTILAVYSGACPRGRDQLACTDDSEGLQSAVDIDTEAGAIYTIVVSGFDGRTGEFLLNIAAAE